MIPPEGKVLQVSMTEVLIGCRIPPSDSDTMAGMTSLLLAAPMTQPQDAISQVTCQMLPYKAIEPSLAPGGLAQT